MNLVQNNNIELPDLISKIDLKRDSNTNSSHSSADAFSIFNGPDISQEISAVPDGIEIKWASNADEIQAAQRLRYKVFTQEMGGRVAKSSSGLDCDLFDDFCEHLIVLSVQTGDVIGTYRVLTPAQAQRVGSTHLDTFFDLTRLRQYKDRMVEIGKGCVDPEHRNGGVIMALWGELFKFMQRNKLDFMVGSTNIPMTQELSQSAKLAASIWTQVKREHLAPIELHIRPRFPLPVDQLVGDLTVELPSLIQAYLRLGAKVLGPPAWLVNSNSVELPMMMRSSELHSKYKKHFLGQ